MKHVTTLKGQVTRFKSTAYSTVATLCHETVQRIRSTGYGVKYFIETGIQRLTTLITPGSKPRATRKATKKKTTTIKKTTRKKTSTAKKTTSKR